MRGWWSGEIEGSTDRLGAGWTYLVPETRFTKMRTTELEPGREVSWLVEESWISFIENREEWTGTTITFDISEQAGKTQVRFTHAGLLTEHECFDVCSNAWSEYILGSLRDRIATGAGRPNSFEGDAALEAVRGA